MIFAVTLPGVPVKVTVMLLLVGQVMVGTVMSRTTTTALQLLVLPALSVAVKFTTLVPKLKAVVVGPLGLAPLPLPVVALLMFQLIGVAANVQLSVALAVKLVPGNAVHNASALTVTDAGQVINGLSSSLTVTLNEQVLLLPL